MSLDALNSYGTPNQVDATIKRIKSNTNWDDFFSDYKYGTLINNPNRIKHIVNGYYNSVTAPPPDNISFPPIMPPRRLPPINSSQKVTPERQPANSFIDSQKVTADLNPIEKKTLLPAIDSLHKVTAAPQPIVGYGDWGIPQFGGNNDNVVVGAGKGKSRRNLKSRKSRKNLRKNFIKSRKNFRKSRKNFRKSNRRH